MTNPPYSDDHKQQCLDVAFLQLRTQQIPFFLLMPNYVASKEYFRDRVQNDEVCYLLPRQPYEYNHPEGTGKSIPPFQSIWFCGIGASRIKLVQQFWHTKNRDVVHNQPTLFLTLDELKSSGSIPTQKRGNPRQRKKRKQHHAAVVVPAESTLVYPTTRTTIVVDTPKKPSKYRDEKGQRKRKRF